MARPTKYKEEYNDLAYKFCLLGATDKQLATFFSCDEREINRWKIKYPEFCQSITRGRVIADAEIAESLYHRAKGYSHPDTQFFVVKVDKDLEEIQERQVIKQYPPDTAAARHWLNNRQRKIWKDKQEIELVKAGQTTVTISEEGEVTIIDEIVQDE